MHKERYVERIVALMKEEGLGMSMEKIADMIGVTKKTLYNQFVSKELLIEDCITYMNNELRKSIEAMSDKNQSASATFRTCLNDVKDKLYSISRVFFRDLQVVYPDKANRDHASGTLLLEEKIRQNLEIGIAQGEYRQLDPVHYAAYLKYAVFGYFMNRVMQGGDWGINEYFDEILDYQLRALRKDK